MSFVDTRAQMVTMPDRPFDASVLAAVGAAGSGIAERLAWRPTVCAIGAWAPGALAETGRAVRRRKR